MENIRKIKQNPECRRNYNIKKKEQSKKIENLNVGEDNKVAHHLFYITAQGVCASGYFEQVTESFYICKGSTIALTVDSAYVETRSFKARERMVKKVCVRDGNFYNVTKDTKCRSASDAACYALGETASYTRWHDIHGKSLHDYYPNKFILSEKGQNVKPSKIEKGNSVKVYSSEVNLKKHLFYMKNNSARPYDAIGYMREGTNFFTLLKGSKLSLNISDYLATTQIGIGRSIFLERAAVKEEKFYVLQKEVTLDTLMRATCYVCGLHKSGLTEWVDEDGFTIKNYYNLL